MASSLHGLTGVGSLVQECPGVLTRAPRGFPGWVPGCLLPARVGLMGVSSPLHLLQQLGASAGGKTQTSGQ